MDTTRRQHFLGPPTTATLVSTFSIVSLGRGAHSRTFTANTGCSVSEHAALFSELQVQREMCAELKRDLEGLRRRLEMLENKGKSTDDDSDMELDAPVVVRGLWQFEVHIC